MYVSFRHAQYNAARITVCERCETWYLTQQCTLRLHARALQILVHGDWPWGLLWSIFECLWTLATKELKFRSDKIVVSVVCPRCQWTPLRLKNACDKAAKATEGMDTGQTEVLYKCNRGCLDRELKWISSTTTNPYTARLPKCTFDLSGFALWPTLHTKRKAVVDAAFAWVSSVADNLRTVVSQHAWSVLTVYVAVGGGVWWQIALQLTPAVSQLLCGGRAQDLRRRRAAQ